LRNAYAKDNNGRKELHLNNKSSFTIDPQGVVIGETKAAVQRMPATRKSIRDLAEKDENVEILGTIVQAFNLRFFEICPHCNRRAKPRGDDGFYCDEHAKVNPIYSYVMNVVLDDGSETIRIVLFRNQVDRLIKKSESEVLKFKDSPDEFESVKNDLIGNMAKLVGRVNKNEMFDRLEFVSSLVYTDVKPEDEIKRLEKDTNVSIDASLPKEQTEKIMNIEDL